MFSGLKLPSVEKEIADLTSDTPWEKNKWTPLFYSFLIRSETDLEEFIHLAQQSCPNVVQTNRMTLDVLNPEPGIYSFKSILLSVVVNPETALTIQEIYTISVYTDEMIDIPVNLSLIVEQNKVTLFYVDGIPIDVVNKAKAIITKRKLNLAPLEFKLKNEKIKITIPEKERLLPLYVKPFPTLQEAPLGVLKEVYSSLGEGCIEELKEIVGLEIERRSRINNTQNLIQFVNRNRMIKPEGRRIK